MTWANIDDLFPEHPKVLNAGGDAAWLYICGLCFVNRNLTEGRIPKTVIARLSDRKSPARLAQRLVEVGLWHEDGDTYRIHDWEKYNETAETVKARKEQARNAARSRWGSGKPKDAQSNAEAMRPASDEQCGEHAGSMQSAYASAMPSHSSPTPPDVNSSLPPTEEVGPALGVEEEEAVQRLAQRLLDRRMRSPGLQPITNRAKWLHKTRAGIRCEQGYKLTQLAEEGYDAAAMVEALDPSPRRPAAVAEPDPYAPLAAVEFDEDEHGVVVVRRLA